MKLAIVGSRSFTDYDLLVENISNIVSKPITLIVSGGAKGTDTLAEDFAKEFNIPLKVFAANWYKNGIYNKYAGFERNHDIVSQADYVIAFWDKVSKGTLHTITLAKRANKLLKVVYV